MSDTDYCMEILVKRIGGHLVLDLDDEKTFQDLDYCEEVQEDVPYIKEENGIEVYHCFLEFSDIHRPSCAGGTFRGFDEVMREIKARAKRAFDDYDAVNECLKGIEDEKSFRDFSISEIK